MKRFLYALSHFCYSSFSADFNRSINPLSANPSKWSNTLKQFVAKLPTNCLSVFDHFVGLALKGLIRIYKVVMNAVYLKLSVRRWYSSIELRSRSTWVLCHLSIKESTLGVYNILIWQWHKFISGIMYTHPEANSELNRTSKMELFPS